MASKDFVGFASSEQTIDELDDIETQHEQFDSRSDVAREMVDRGLRDWREETTEYPGHDLIVEGTRLSALVSILAAIMAVGDAVSAESVALAGSAMLVFLVAHLTGQWLAASGRL